MSQRHIRGSKPPELALSDSELAALPAMQDPHVPVTVQRLLNGRNVLLYGMAGGGKSCFLRAVMVHLAKMGINTACTGTTGVSAVGFMDYGLLGSTLHSWAGIGKGEGSVADIMRKLRNEPDAWERIESVRVLAIEEVSMLSAATFSLLDHVFRAVRGAKNKPMGGVTCVFSGDFSQLPPVKASFAFESANFLDLDCWIEMFFENYRFTDDPTYCELLKRVRVGGQTEADMEMLRTRVQHVDLDCEVPKGTVMLFPLRREADSVNSRRMAQLAGLPHKFVAHDVWRDSRARWKPQSAVPMGIKSTLDKVIPPNIELKVGAQVMMKRNNKRYNLVNGNIGTVLLLSDDSAQVDFGPKIGIVRIEEAKFEMGTPQWHVERHQLPLIPAWALTIHGSQGLTLERVIASLLHVFECGQAYVLLSRVRHLKDLRLLGISDDCIKTSDKANYFANYAQEKAQRQREDEEKEAQERASKKRGRIEKEEEVACEPPTKQAKVDTK